jgi:hypothetical protein
MSESNSRKFSKGEIDITGELDFTSATMRGHIIPDTDNAYDIGSAQYKIRDGYFSDNSLWVGDNNKIGASGGKKKFSKRKKGKTPKKMFDVLIGPGNAFDNETALKDKFKEEIHDPAPDNTLDPGHADFHPSIKKWLEFAALHGQGQRKRPDDIFDDDDFDSEDDIAAVEGLQAALDAKLNASLAYVHPTTAGNKHIPTAGATDQYLKYSASGTAVCSTIAQGVLPFAKADGTSDPINLTTNQEVPFTKTDGTTDNIALTI